MRLPRDTKAVWDFIEDHVLLQGFVLVGGILNTLVHLAILEQPPARSLALDTLFLANRVLVKKSESLFLPMP